MSLALRHFIPNTPSVSLRERARSAAGALLGILCTGLICRAAIGPDAALPALIAPMGASAVLLFAVPASPLAQPWSIVGGNGVSALVGVAAAMLIPNPFVAASVAICVAIALMMSLRCVHPPSGAVALTAVLGGPGIHDLGFGFVLWPVGANTLAILTVALVFNNLVGRSYPHVPSRPAGAPGEPPAANRVGFTSADLDEALKGYDQLLEVDRSDLETILRRVQMHGYARRAGETVCADIMSRQVVGIAPDAPLSEALDLLRGHHIKVLPVTDESARVLGIVTQTDLLDNAVWDSAGPRLGWARRLSLAARRGRAPAGRVEDIMTAPVVTARPETRIAEVVARLSESGLHHMPVVGEDDRLVGIISQSDLVVALLADAAERGAKAEPVPA